MPHFPERWEVEPASIDQVRMGRNGKFISVTDDVGGVAKALAEVDPHLRLRFSVSGDYFVVYYRPDNAEEGDGYLVLTAKECDMRIVNRVRRVGSSDYDYLEEVDRIDREAEAAQEAKHQEAVGEIGERLAHALRRDRGLNQHRVFPGERRAKDTNR